jgi:hypothetical protein
LLRLVVSLGFLMAALVAFVGRPDFAAAQVAGQCDPNLTVGLSIPPQGPANVTATVTPEVPLAPPGQGTTGTYFLAWVVDLDVATALPAGQPVPTGNPNIILGATRTQNFDHLAPGDHRVSAVLVGSDGIPCNPAVSDSVSFRLQAPAPPATGTGTVAPATATWPLLVAALIIVACSIGGLLVFAARGWTTSGHRSQQGITASRSTADLLRSTHPHFGAAPWPRPALSSMSLTRLSRRR